MQKTSHTQFLENIQYVFFGSQYDCQKCLGILLGDGHFKKILVFKELEGILSSFEILLNQTRLLFPNEHRRR